MSLLSFSLVQADKLRKLLYGCLKKIATESVAVLYYIEDEIF